MGTLALRVPTSVGFLGVRNTRLKSVLSTPLAKLLGVPLCRGLI